jgi:hypothetical protein
VHNKRKEKDMKIQSLAIMFIIIILPISMVLASYTQSRVTTISLQSKYDSKLKDATYDALKAYQLNSLNDNTSEYANSKIRDIKASVNTFFNSIATNFSTAGYSKTTLQNYVPAVVYTMYDGYYIYSPYTNTWGNIETDQIPNQSSGTYKDGETLYGLKPYVYYSCRYKSGDNNDIVITYSLDNYIAIQGKIGGKTVSKYGYVLSDINVISDEEVTYKGITINTENGYTENVMVNGTVGTYKCIKKNGTKYYWDDSNQKAFSVLNGKRIEQSGISKDEFINNKNAVNYFREAYEMKNYIENTTFLRELSTNNIVDINTGASYSNAQDNPYQSISKIFNFSNIESEDSDFNTHRRDVIKYSIERNLSIAISNYNNYSGASVNFQMPKLKETDWDVIMDNISIISFLQGLSIGGKIYNGYSVISNTKNSDVVAEDSIYIKDSYNYLCNVAENGLNSNAVIGIYNINLERKSGESSSGSTQYYYPITGDFSYDSIVEQNNINDKYNGNIYNYLALAENKNLAKVYYTALARERYGMYRPKIEI